MWFRKKKRILFGAIDIGYRIDLYTKYIQKHFNNELEPESFSKYILPNEHFKTNYTFSCPIDKTPPIKFYLYTFTFFIRALFRYQIFHFISGETILTWKLRRFELSIYRLLGKKIIMHFVGSDIRNEDYLKEKDEHLEEYLRGEYAISTPISDQIQLKLIKNCRKYCSHILVSTPDLLQIIPEAIYIPVFIDVENIPLVPQKILTNNKLMILHSPSGYNTKGSDYIHNVLNIISEKYGDKIIIETPGKELKKLKKNYALSRYDLFKKMNDSDIVIDQMLIGWYGLKSVEALFLGCEVVCFIEEDLTKYLMNENPIHNASVLNLEEKLEALIETLIEENDRIERRLKNENFILKNHVIENYEHAFQKIWLTSY